MTAEDAALLKRAGAAAGIDSRQPQVIRLSENAIYRLPRGIVARISRPGQAVTAAKEVNVAKWLEDCTVSAVRVLCEIEQPIVVDERAVTFWHELPAHRPGSTIDVAQTLKGLHLLAPPTSFELPKLAPFTRLMERIGAAAISDDDMRWMTDQVMQLSTAYSALLPRHRLRVVHGDAWSGNIVRTGDDRLVLLDFERCSLGLPEWDLVSTAVSYVTTGWMKADEWAAYCSTYGKDVTMWHGFEVLRDIRELRMTTMAVQLAAKDPAAFGEQAAHRLACLRGQRGPRPWAGWRPVP